MKAVILAGGLGTRLSEETHLKPKPMVEIGGKPILWHIMKIFSAHGVNEFIICAGYKGYMIKEYFANYFLHTSDVSFNMVDDSVEIIERRGEPWKVTVVDTGDNTMTGGRLKRVEHLIGNDEDFCFTYGDGVCDVDITELIRFHRAHGKVGTMTAEQPPGRYVAVEFGQGDEIARFTEKPQGDHAWINGGFFVLQPSALDLIKGDQDSWESYPLETLAARGELAGYCHRGFWQPMDTLRDKNHLEELWGSGKAPWKVW